MSVVILKTLIPRLFAKTVKIPITPIKIVLGKIETTCSNLPSLSDDEFVEFKMDMMTKKGLPKILKNFDKISKLKYKYYKLTNILLNFLNHSTKTQTFFYNFFRRIFFQFDKRN